MKISKLIKELERIQRREGDIEVTCTHATEQEDGDKIFETTVENITVRERGNSIRAKWLKPLTEKEAKQKLVRLWL